MIETCLCNGKDGGLGLWGLRLGGMSCGWGLHASLVLGFSLVWVSLGGKAQGNLRSINLMERNPEQKGTGLKHLELVDFPPWTQCVHACWLLFW